MSMFSQKSKKNIYTLEQQAKDKAQAQARDTRLERAGKAINFSRPNELSTEAKISLLNQYVLALQKVRNEIVASFDSLVNLYGVPIDRGAIFKIDWEIKETIEDIAEYKVAIVKPDLNPESNRRDNR